MERYSAKRTTEIVPGDVLFHHGMRLLVDAPLRETSDGALAVDALVLNPDEVRAAGLVPFGWIVREDGSRRWTVKGNDLARWNVVVPPVPAGTMCEWFAMCENEATRFEPHPVLGLVPTCERCMDVVS